jgi:hypothetical protein
MGNPDSLKALVEKIRSLKIGSVPEERGKKALEAAFTWNQAINAVLKLDELEALYADAAPTQWKGFVKGDHARSECIFDGCKLCADDPHPVAAPTCEHGEHSLCICHDCTFCMLYGKCPGPASGICKDCAAEVPQ